MLDAVNSLTDRYTALAHSSVSLNLHIQPDSPSTSSRPSVSIDSVSELWGYIEKELSKAEKNHPDTSGNPPVTAEPHSDSLYSCYSLYSP